VGHLRKGREKTIVVAIKKESGAMIFNPSSETLIEKGDVVIILGEKKHLGMLEQLVQSVEILHNKRRSQ
jgi:voltage-gated potassium channel